MIKKFELVLLVSTLVISTLLTNYSNASTEELTQWLIADEISTLESKVFALTPVMDKNISKALVTDRKAAARSIVTVANNERWYYRFDC
jgi:hypothetical protein